MEGEASCKAGGCLPGSAPGSRSRRAAGRSSSLRPQLHSRLRYVPQEERQLPRRPQNRAPWVSSLVWNRVEMFIAEGIVKGSGDCGYTTKKRLTA